MREDFLVFGAPLISEDEIAEVVATLRSGWIGSGPRVKQFERRFEEYVGVRHAVAVNSCTSALHLALHVLDIGPGDEVITTPYTWCSTANVIVHRGARPVFVDVDRATGNMDPARIEPAVTKRTRAILPVHLGGRACDMDAIMEIAQRRGLKVIEDAAHALEATWKGRRAGSIGDCGAFSFYATKNVTTAEGGMAVTADAALAERLRILSLNGTSADAWKRFQADGPSHVQVVEAGYKYNMTDIQAALGLKQLEKVERYLEHRDRLWRFYDEALAGLPLIRPAPAEAGLPPRAASVFAPGGHGAHAADARRAARGAQEAAHRHRRPLHRAAPAPVLSAAVRLSRRAVPQRGIPVRPHVQRAALAARDGGGRARRG